LIGDQQLALDGFEQREDDVAVEIAEQVAEREQDQRIARVLPARRLN